LRAFGLKKWDEGAQGLTAGQREVLGRANAILGFP
jgi:hypothetical protein